MVFFLSSRFRLDTLSKKAVNGSTREGALKSAFNYLLLDPRKTGGLLADAHHIGDQAVSRDRRRQ